MMEDTQTATQTPATHPSNLQVDIQDIFLAKLREKKVLVSIYLVNGVRLQGYVKSFDNHVIYMDDPVSQIVYKRSICSIMQAQDVRPPR